VVEVITRRVGVLPQVVACATIGHMGMIEKILRAGRARGLSQLEIERRARLATNRISKVKDAEDRMRWGEVKSLAAVVGASLDWLASDAPDDLPADDRNLAWIAETVRDLGPTEARRRLLQPTGPEPRPVEVARPLGHSAYQQPHRAGEVLTNSTDDPATGH
jgi:transcriptional regulator with XRE-family HTH domain